MGIGVDVDRKVQTEFKIPKVGKVGGFGLRNYEYLFEILFDFHTIFSGN